MTSFANRTFDTTGRSKTAYGTGANNTTNFNFSVAETLADFRSKTTPKQLITSNSMPKLRKREKSRDNKLYKCPPTPPNELLNTLERSFTLDCIAVGNISEDYSRANPKLGSAIPPYDSQNDKKVKNYFNYFGVKELLKRTNQHESHESIAGKTYDNFYRRGHGTKYLQLRNKNASNGHHAEVYEGHQLYMRDKLCEMFSYNNNYGYRRNAPKLRQNPSTFMNDVRGSLRINQTFKKHYNSQEISEHLKNSYILGYPFYDEDYRKFHPGITYLIKIKVKEVLDDDEKLKINILSKTCNTGLIPLDEVIAVNDDKQKNSKIFDDNKTSLFSFPYDDLRAINGIIIEREKKSSKSIFITQIELELQRSTENKIFKFPFNGWLNAGKQNERAEEIKKIHGTKNSIILFPNAKPKFEYKIRTYPQLFSNSLYKIELDCNVYDPKEPDDYYFEIICDEKLPFNASVILKLQGNKCETQLIKISNSKMCLKIDEADVGDIKYIQLKSNRVNNLFIKRVNVTKSNQVKHIFEINENIEEKEFKIYSSTTMEKLEQQNGKRPTFFGYLTIRIEGDKSCTNYMKLNRYSMYPENENFVFKKYAQNVGSIKGMFIRFDETPGKVCHINSIKITHGQDIVKFDTNLSLKDGQETTVPENYVMAHNAKNDETRPRLLLNLIGDRNISGYLTLEDSKPGKESFDEFIVDSIDLGQIEKFRIKYHGEAQTKIFLNSIDILDPWGKNYSFQIDNSFYNGQERTLPTNDDNSKSPSKSHNASKNKSMSQRESKNPSPKLNENEYDENFEDIPEDTNLNKQIAPLKKTPSPQQMRQKENE